MQIQPIGKLEAYASLLTPAVITTTGVIASVVVHYLGSAGAFAAYGFTATAISATTGLPLLLGIIAALALKVRLSHHYTELMYELVCKKEGISEDQADLLFTAGAQIDGRINESPPLIRAVCEECKEGYADSKTVIKRLINLGASLEVTDHDGWTLFMCAVEANKLSVIKYLVENGANLDTCTPTGSTPLILAIRSGYLEIVQYLVENKANLNTCTPTGSTPLILATRSGYLKIVQCLVDNGANLDAKDALGKTALEWPPKNCEIWTCLNRAMTERQA